MSHFATFSKYFRKPSSRSVRRICLQSLVAVLACTYIIYQATAHSNGQGIGGLTNKGGNTTGCYCHCASSSSNTTVTISTTASGPFYTGQSYTFKVTVSSSDASEKGAGTEVSVKSGSLATANTAMQLISGELTHTAAITSLPASWTFTYTAPSSIPSSGYDTLFATGNAVNLDGSNGGVNCTDNWNFAPKYAIAISAPVTTKAIALSRTAVALGNVRVGGIKRDSFQIKSTSTSAITVNTSLVSGTVFKRYPTGSNRSISAGTYELDSAEFTPTARGSFTDSLIITSDVDNATDQRKAIYLSGTGIAGIYSTSISSLAFNNLRTGLTRQLPFIYSNTGDDTLFMQSGSISGSGFTIVSGPNRLNLPPNASDTIMVQFAPTSKGSFSGSLTPSATGQTLSSVSLTGTGVSPTIGLISPNNIGGVRVNQTTQGTYTIQNTGTDTLHISSAAITAGATSKFSIATPPASTILPGSQTTVTFNYAPTQEKFDTITFTIHSDDPTTPIANALIVAQGLEPHILVDQVDTVDLGAVKINGTGSSSNILVQNTGSDVLNLSTVAVGPAPFSLASRKASIDAGSSGNVVVQFTPTTVGNFTGSVGINSDDPQKPIVTVYVKGQGINSALSVPTNVDFQSVTVATERDTTITLQNTGAASVNILKYTLTSTDGAFGIVDTSAHAIAANSSITVSLKFTPSAAQTYSGSLAILTDDQSAPTRTVTLAGHGLQGSLSLSMSTLDFGSIDSTTSKTDTVTICNTGTASITVDALNFSGANSSAFTAKPASALPFSLTPGGCLGIAVTFLPQHSGPYSESLSIHTRELTSLSIALSGAGNPPKHTGFVANNEVSESWKISVNPNPSRDIAMLNISVPRTSQADVILYDAAGRIVQQAFHGLMSAGMQSIQLNVASLASGSYFLRVISENTVTGESRIVVKH